MVLTAELILPFSWDLPTQDGGYLETLMIIIFYLVLVFTILPTKHYRKENISDSQLIIILLILILERIYNWKS